MKLCELLHLKTVQWSAHRPLYFSCSMLGITFNNLLISSQQIRWVNLILYKKKQTVRPCLMLPNLSDCPVALKTKEQLTCTSQKCVPMDSPWRKESTSKERFRPQEDWADLQEYSVFCHSENWNNWAQILSTLCLNCEGGTGLSQSKTSDVARSLD